jgi:hypothetical protein
MLYILHKLLISIGLVFHISRDSERIPWQYIKATYKMTDIIHSYSATYILRNSNRLNRVK